MSGVLKSELEAVEIEIRPPLVSIFWGPHQWLSKLMLSSLAPAHQFREEIEHIADADSHSVDSTVLDSVVSVYRH